MSKISKFDRIVVFQPRSGWVCDLGAGSALSPNYAPSESRFDVSSGISRAISRRRPLNIPVFDDDKIKHLAIMHKEGCEIRAILIGPKTHIMYGMDSAFNFVDFGGTPGGVSGSRIEMDNTVFNGSIYQSNDLVSGIPWNCETATEEDGSYYLPGPQGYQGYRWVVASGDEIDDAGLFTGSGAPQLEMFFPMQGLQFVLGGAFIGNIKTLDHSGATLTTTTKASSGTAVTGTIDSGTWKIQINLTSGSRPELTVSSAGSLASDRIGECVDCSDPTAEATGTPSWSS